jgi:hypothetical protein
MRVQCGLCPEPPLAGSDDATPAPTSAPTAEAPAPVAAPRVSAAEVERVNEQALQDEIYAAMSQRFGQQVPKSAGDMLYNGGWCGTRRSRIGRSSTRSSPRPTPRPSLPPLRAIFMRP